MRRALVVLLLSIAPVSSALAADAGAPAPPPAIPACVHVATQSWWVPYGYNHLVRIENGCSKAATCTVSTDVNPEKQTAEVAASSKVELTTFMGSASSTFTARVGCVLH